MKYKDGRLIEIAQEGEWWKVEKQVHKNVSFIGWCTNCWIVYREDISTGEQTKLVVKDLWPSISHVENEYHILKHILDENINDGRSLPHLHSWNRVGAATKNIIHADSGIPPGSNTGIPVATDSVPAHVNNSTLHGSAPGPVHIDDVASAPSTHNDGGAPMHIDSGIMVIDDATTQCHISLQSGRVHCHQLTGPVAYPISACVNLKDFVGIFIDVVQGVSFLSLVGSSGY